MTTENLSTLKIHKLTQEQYDRELAAGRIDENAIYLTPDEDYDISWNDLKDKPFYEEGRQVISWDGNTEGLHYFTRYGLSYYLVSDVQPTLEEVQNHIVTGIEGGENFSGTLPIQDLGNEIELGIVVLINYVYGVLRGDNGVDYDFFPGTYFLKAADNTYTTSLVYGSTTVKPLDEKFIPAAIARISDIPTDYLTELPEDLARKSDIPTDYLKEVPSEYITETELEQAIKLKNLVDGEGQGSIKSTGAISASGEYSFAEGPGTMATGYASHAEGTATVASGDFSHAEGGGAFAEGEFAHAEGKNTRALGQHSHAEGQNTVAAGADSHVQGRYNVRDDSNLYAHIVGNGTADTRANIHTVDWQGNAWFAGDVYVKSTSGINKDTGSRKLVSAPKSLTSGDLLIHDGSDWAKIAKSDLIADVIAALPPAEEAEF